MKQYVKAVNEALEHFQNIFPKFSTEKKRGVIFDGVQIRKLRNESCMPVVKISALGEFVYVQNKEFVGVKESEDSHQPIR